MTQRIIAMLPTYNEAENIGPLIDALLAVLPGMEVLVVDDDSPDGTWKLVAGRAQTDPRVHLLHRTTNRGRGLAGIAGFRRAVELGADWIVEMDADWSHDPRWIPSMMERAAQGADVVIGSRLVPGGGEQGRHAARGLITAAANFYIRTMLGLPARDATSGFRLFSRACMAALPWDQMNARGPEVVQEVLLAAHARGFRVAEVPILFVERRHGQSTFNWKIMVRSLAAMARLRWSPGALVPGARLTAGPAAWAALPLCPLYGQARRLDRAFKVHLRRPRRLARPVISIGNLTVGGTGKTPIVQLVARQLLELGRRPAIVSRGYRAEQAPARPLLVSDGRQILAGVAQAGDEPLTLARACPGACVVVHPDRHASARLAITQAQADAVVLDDGFQHDRLARDLDIVLWDARDLPGYQRLLPAGRLREGLGALRRAGAIVLTHAEYLDPAVADARLDHLTRTLKRHAPQAAFFTARTRVSAAAGLGETAAAVTNAPASSAPWPWDGQPVVAVSALARPESFESTLAATGARLARHFTYPDHYAYQPADATQWRQALEQTQARWLLTTAKDAVKLEGLPLEDLPVLVVHIQAAIEPADRWEFTLRQALKA